MNASSPSAATAKREKDSRRLRIATASPFAFLWMHRGAVLAVMDALSINLAFLLAYCLRFSAPVMRLLPARHVPDIVPYVGGTLILTVLWVALLWREQEYENGLLALREMIFAFRALLRSGVQALLGLMAVSYLFRELLSSRAVYLAAWVTAFAFMLAVREGLRMLDRWLKDEGIVLCRILVAGLNANAREFASLLREMQTPARVVAFAATESESPRYEAGVPIWPNLRAVRERYEEHPFDILLLAEDLPAEREANRRREDFIALMNFCESSGIMFYLLPSMLDVMVARQEVGSFAGKPLIRLQDAFLHPVYRGVKRLMDLAIALSVGIAGLPLWLVIAASIKLESRGPVLYRQQRVGLHGRSFGMYKFRSMIADADTKLKDLVNFDRLEEPVFNIRRDPRVTRVGWILRRSSLDEIPQLLNVLRGEMSIVGPRPERVELVAQYNPWQWRRVKAKPGITGYQQVMNRGDPSLQRRIEYDLFYMKHQDLSLDLFIILKTLVVILRGDGMR